MKTVIQILQTAKKEAQTSGKSDLVQELSHAISILDGYEENEKRKKEELQLYQTLSTMSPWEQKQYIDSWNGHGS